MDKVDRRRLYLAGGLCALGAGLGAARWVVMRPQPPAGHPLPVELGDLAPGRLMTVEWHGRTVWILRRSADEIAALAGYESFHASPWPHCFGCQRREKTQFGVSPCAFAASAFAGQLRWRR